MFRRRRIRENADAFPGDAKKRHERFHKDSRSDLGDASTVQFQRTCAMEINTVLRFVEFRDPDDFVVEVDRRFLGMCLQCSPDGVEVPDMMKRQERTFCTLMIPVSVEIHHKRYVAIAESHRLERSIMILML